jgi:hypothetical protein
MVKYLKPNICYKHFLLLKHRIKHFASVIISAQVSTLLKVGDETFAALAFAKLADILSLAPQDSLSIDTSSLGCLITFVNNFHFNLVVMFVC